jgi:hypothetical protein
VECLTAGDCPGLDTECQTRTCVAGFCGVFFAPADTPLSAQISGDCRRTVCDGQGGTFSIPDNTDLPPDDMNECTVSVCIDGYPAYQPAPRGTPCTQGGVVCDGQGVCVASISTCGDGLLNGDETDVDCGGSCPPCDLGRGCVQNADCMSGLCCGGVCSDPDSVTTCGNCQQICPPDFACLDGNCVCPEPRALCGAACVDLNTDPANCSYCGRNCNRFMSTAWCQDGACCGTVGGETVCCEFGMAPNVCTRQEWYDCGKFVPPCLRTVSYPCCMSG